MRKLKLQMQITVDGFVAGPEGQSDWMTFSREEKLLKYRGDLTNSMDTILMGRKMSDGFISFWESVAKNPEHPEFHMQKLWLKHLKLFSVKHKKRLMV